MKVLYLREPVYIIRSLTSIQVYQDINNNRLFEVLPPAEKQLKPGQ